MNKSETLQTGEPVGASLQRQPNPTQHSQMLDDAPAVRRPGTEGLACSGCTVDVVENESIAWNALQLESYDLLITYYNLPEISGVEVLNKIHAACLKLPVIMGLGAMLPDALNRQPQTVIEVTLIKPYGIVEFLEVVKEVLPAITGSRDEIVLLPVWQSQPSAASLRL